MLYSKYFPVHRPMGFVSFNNLGMGIYRLNGGLRVSAKNKCARLRRILVRIQGASTSAYLWICARRLSENALLPKLFVILKKIILGISTICLWLFFKVFLDFEQNCYPRTGSWWMQRRRRAKGQAGLCIYFFPRPLIPSCLQTAVIVPAFKSF